MIKYVTYTEQIIARKNIRITEGAYNLLKCLKNNDKASFSDVILKHYPIPAALGLSHSTREG